MRKLKFFFALSTIISIHAFAQQADFRTFYFQNSIAVERNHFATKANTVGTQYLFPNWVKGSVVDNSGNIFDGLFNFDKITQELYLKLDSSSNNAFMVDKQQIKSATLTDGLISYQLERVPSLNNNNLYRILEKGKYSLYGFTKTKFIPSNYTSNGIVTSGNLYDEYKDEVHYYIVFPDGTNKEISLKKKAIKSVLENEKNTVDLFFKNNDAPSIDENYLKQLVTVLNQ